MTGIEALAVVIAALIVPYAVQLIKHGAIGGNAARWVAIATSVAAGCVCGLVGGIPTTAAAWVTCIMSTVGGIQVSYAAYKSVGITSKWLDALADLPSKADADHSYEMTGEDDR